MVSSSDSFFLVAELAKSTLIILALVRFPAISKVFRVRVEGSKNKLAMLMSSSEARNCVY
jgi:hypothetical protein